MPIYRLGARAELWAKGVREALEQCPQVVLILPDDALQATLSGLEVKWMLWEEVSGWRGFEDQSEPAPGGLELSPDAAIIVPMSPVEELILLVDRLLGPGGCPWDQEQTHASLKKHLIEEAYEVCEAVDSGSSDKLEEEIGDLLLQPVMHGQMASAFSTETAARRVVAKLIHRHPHVFGSHTVSSSADVLKNWDKLKQEETATLGAPDSSGSGKASTLGGVPRSMPALMRAYEISKRAARSGFEWPTIEAVYEKLAEEERELRNAVSVGEVEAELGDLLFTAVNIARWLKVEPETALQAMVNRFVARFEAMEASAAKPLGELRAEEWDALWEQAKNPPRI